MRDAAGTNGNIIKAYPKGTAVLISNTKTVNGSEWAHVKIDPNGPIGWMCKTTSNGSIYLSTTKSSDDKKTVDTKTTTTKVKDKQEETKKKEETTLSKKEVKQLVSSLSGKSLASSYSEISPDNLDEIYNLTISNIEGIYGCPYQFTPYADLRITSQNGAKSTETSVMQLNGKGIGRVYADKIVSRMPLILFTPGIPEFLESYTKDAKAGVLESLLNYATGSISNGDAESLVDAVGRYYTFKFDYQQYFDYVEPMLWACAKFLGIENKKVSIGDINDKPLGTFPWRKAGNTALSEYMYSEEFIAFYADSEDSVNESFSTSTTQSALASSTADTLSSFAREVMFLTGAYTNIDAIKVQNVEEYEEKTKNLQELLKKPILKNSKLLNNLANMATTIAAGGRIYFPQIWEDTEYSKSYNINFKLRTPDGDKLSWFLNICVPLIHLICMAAPRELSNPNLYLSPFLIRAYCKGIFNCDMGIVTGLNITKGKSGSWTIDGLPTEVDVSMDLKDLYSVFAMTGRHQDTAAFVRNIGMIDYLASTCGLNINKPELKRSLDLYLLLTKGKFTNLGTRAFGNISQALDNKIRYLYEGVILKK